MIAQRLVPLSCLTAPLLLSFAIGCSETSRPLATAPDASAPLSSHDIAPPGAIVLRGTILTPDGAITHGYVGIVDGRIVSVSDRDPGITGAVTVNTYGIIAPGMVDIHNHLPWNVMPRWIPGRVFNNRHEWRADSEYRQAIADPFNRLLVANRCDMNTWGELRALVGGTTSAMETHPAACIHGLVRNLDLNSGFYGTTELDREHIFNVIDMPPASQPAARAAFAAAAQFFFINNPFYEALVIHAAEGTDAFSHEEFTFLQSQNLLNAKGAIIHGVTLRAPDFVAMAVAGSALVWSPRSNLELYAATADVGAALDVGVDVALAPDWAITGSSNMLDELRVASLWNRQRLGGRLSDRSLFDMVTIAPARIAGVEDEVGAIRVGLRADLLVITGNQTDPFGAFVAATPGDVQLVLIEGVPLYGDKALMARFWERSDLEELAASFGRKALASRATGISVSDLTARLGAAMRGEGMTLAPLVEQHE
jgi:5-methylthioadenosine/S-adenosylhomocysteine deaminase